MKTEKNLKYYDLLLHLKISIVRTYKIINILIIIQFLMQLRKWQT